MSGLSNVLDFIRKGVELVEKASPLIREFAPVLPVVQVVGIAKTVTEILDNVRERIAEGKVVATADDAETIRRLADRLAAENDKLAAYINEH